jgi:transposase-like protein
MSTHKIRKIHTAEFKVEALRLADKIGVAAVARELKLYNSQLYNWRSASEHKQLPVNVKLSWPQKLPA